VVGKELAIVHRADTPKLDHCDTPLSVHEFRAEKRLLGAFDTNLV
jgi:hypothetical protein